MRKLVAAAGLFFLLPMASMAQNFAKAEVFTGFSYMRMEKTNRMGWQAALNANINKNLGIVTDASGYYGSNSQTIAGISTKVTSSIHSVLIGPRVSDPRGRWTPFAQALFGWSRIQSTADSSNSQGVFLSVPNSANALGVSLGGGLDYRLGNSIAFRIAEVDYFLLHSHDQKPQGVRLSTGVNFLLGERK